MAPGNAPDGHVRLKAVNAELLPKPTGLPYPVSGVSTHPEPGPKLGAISDSLFHSSHLVCWQNPISCAFEMYPNLNLLSSFPPPSCPDHYKILSSLYLPHSCPPAARVILLKQHYNNSLALFQLSNGSCHFQNTIQADRGLICRVQFITNHITYNSVWHIVGT